MNNRKPLDAAFEKIANSKKVNLESQKVELTLVDDVKKYINKGIQIEKQLKREMAVYSGLTRSANLFEKSYNELLSAAKEVGFEVPSELKGLEDIAKGFRKKGEAVKKAYNLF